MKPLARARHEVLLDRIRDRQITHLIRSAHRATSDFSKPGVIGKSPRPGPDSDPGADHGTNCRTKLAASYAGSLLDGSVITVRDGSDKQQGRQGHLDRIVLLSAQEVERFLTADYPNTAHGRCEVGFEMIKTLHPAEANRHVGNRREYRVGNSGNQVETRLGET